MFKSTFKIVLHCDPESTALIDIQPGGVPPDGVSLEPPIATLVIVILIEIDSTITF